MTTTLAARTGNMSRSSDQKNSAVRSQADSISDSQLNAALDLQISRGLRIEGIAAAQAITVPETSEEQSNKRARSEPRDLAPGQASLQDDASASSSRVHAAHPADRAEAPPLPLWGNPYELMQLLARQTKLMETLVSNQNANLVLPSASSTAPASSSTQPSAPQELVTSYEAHVQAVSKQFKEKLHSLAKTEAELLVVKEQLEVMNGPGHQYPERVRSCRTAANLEELDEDAQMKDVVVSFPPGATRRQVTVAAHHLATRIQKTMIQESLLSRQKSLMASTKKAAFVNACHSWLPPSTAPTFAFVEDSRTSQIPAAQRDSITQEAYYKSIDEFSKSKAAIKEKKDKVRAAQEQAKEKAAHEDPAEQLKEIIEIAVQSKINAAGGSDMDVEDEENPKTPYDFHDKLKNFLSNVKPPAAQEAAGGESSWNENPSKKRNRKKKKKNEEPEDEYQNEPKTYPKKPWRPWKTKFALSWRKPWKNAKKGKGKGSSRSGWYTTNEGAGKGKGASRYGGKGGWAYPKVRIWT